MILGADIYQTKIKAFFFSVTAAADKEIMYRNNAHVYEAYHREHKNIQ